MRRSILLALFLLSCPLTLLSQTTPDLEQGLKPYGSYGGGDIDLVNLATGNLTLKIPLLSYPQRGALKLDYYLVYNSEQWHPRQIVAAPDLTYKFFWGPPPGTAPCTRSTAGVQLVSSTEWCVGDQTTIIPNGDNTNSSFTIPIARDPFGGVHQLGQMVTGGYNYESVDTSGIQMTGDPSTGTAKIFLRNGSQPTVDTNGNTLGPTDTVGRIISLALTSAPTTGCPAGSTAAASFTVPSFNNGTTSTSTYTWCTEAMTFTTNYNVPTAPGNIPRYVQGTAQETVNTALILPNGTSWLFAYDSWGNLSKLTLPTGGSISYGWTQVPTCGDNSQSLALYDQAVATRTVDPHDGTSPAVWSYAYNTPQGEVTTETDPSKNDTVHTFGLGSGCAEFETKTEYYQGSSTSGGTKLKTVATTYNSSSNPLDMGATLAFVVPTTVTTTWANGQSSSATKSYDSGATVYQAGINQVYGYSYTSPFVYGNVISESDSDYGGQILRQTQTTYQWQSNASFLQANLLDLPSAVQTKNGAGYLCAETDYAYDNPAYLTATSGVPNHFPATGQRGNLSSTSHIYSTNPCSGPTLPGGVSYTTYTHMYDTGLPQEIVDPLGHATSFTYDPTYSAYLTATTNALGQSVAASYDSNTGLINSYTDLNGHSSTFSYDNLGRITRAISPPVSAGTPETDFNYNDSANTVTRTIAAAPDPAQTTTIVFDGLGRETHRYVSDSPSQDTIDTAYDLNGRVDAVSNPYRSTKDSTYGLTTYSYDPLDRKKLEVEPDGGQLQWSYSGSSVTATDERGYSWVQTDDGLGRLIQVQEPTGALTGYTYNALSDLLSVNQPGLGSDVPRTRSFTYDSMSRLVTATNPENGTVCYGEWSGSGVGQGTCQNGYDAAGNLQYKTDARGVVLVFNYDNLNRLLRRYSNASVGGWVDDTYVYDQPFGNGIGRMTSMGTSSTGTQFTYDPMGRVVHTLETTLNIPWKDGFGFNAAYDLAGNVTALTYPDGRQIAQTWDGAGHLSTVKSAASGSLPEVDYILGIVYTPAGAESSLILGSGIEQAAAFNNRLQTCLSGAATSLPGSSGSTNLLLKEYFHSPSPETLCGNAFGNNGNVWSIADALNAGLSQTFQYDSLKRLISAASANGSYSQNYTIDSFGNMYPENTANYPVAYSINPRTNQLLRNNTDFKYDASGDLTYVTSAFGTETYSTNAVGQLEAAYSGNNPKNLYHYNGDDLRSTKTVGTLSTDYLYFNHQLMAELNSGVWTDHVYSNGRKVASASNSDVRLHLSGVMPSGSGLSAQTSIGSNYVVKTGDQLLFRMYNRNANAGVTISFTDGSTTDSPCLADQNGQCLNQESTQGAWVDRVVDLGTSENGKTISNVLLEDGSSAPSGQFDVMIADMSILSADGSVTQIVGELPGGPCAATGSAGITGLACVSETVTSTTDFAGPPQTVRYYLSDPLGTAQLELTSAGAPLWKGEFTPFGQEIDTQTTANNYKFTGKEHDAETGADYFGARYYMSSTGRFMTPDWADKPEAVPYSDLTNPQSLNLYGYVNNNPLSNIDNNGHATIEIRYTSIGPGYTHSYLVVTDTNGARTYFRAGPSAGGGSGALISASGGLSGQSSHSNSNASNSSSPGSGPGGGDANTGPFGALHADSGDYVPGTIDYETNPAASTTLLSNDLSASGYIDQLKSYSDNINNSNIPYNPLSTNSNAYAAGAAKFLGLPVPTPPVNAPGSGTTLPVPRKQGNTVKIPVKATPESKAGSYQ